MQRLFFLLATLSILAFLGCDSSNPSEPSPDHQLRITNNYTEDIQNLTVGNVSYGTVKKGTTTEYKPIDVGSHNLSGKTLSGGQFTGSVSASGNGTHLWTLTFNKDGTLLIKED